jgi:hypothetical protein
MPIGASEDHMHQRWLLAVTSVLLTTSPAGAQGVFTSRVDMVPLTVTVTDHAGRYVSGLTERDFAVFEDGCNSPCRFLPANGRPSTSRSCSIPVAA